MLFNKKVQMDIETLNKIQQPLESLSFNADEFILEAIEHEIERRNIDDVLNVVFDKIRISANERIENECPNQKVCTITVVANPNVAVRFTQPEWNREVIEPNTNKKIIFILESPHKNEFKDNKPLGPAQGTTGKNIKNFLGDVLTEIGTKLSINWGNGDVYDLILMNAIQSQCSLGFETKYFRDLMFVGLWFKGKKQNFKTELNRLNIRSDDIVINACTDSDHSKFKYIYPITNPPYSVEYFNQSFLRDFFENNAVKFQSTKKKPGIRFLVHEAILEIYGSSNFPFYYRAMSHPSGWAINKTTKNVIGPIPYDL